MSTTRAIAVAAAAVSALHFVGVADAQIASISGLGVIINNPAADFPQPDTFESSFVQGINERIGLELGTDLTIDDLEDIIGSVTLPSGTTVSSHLIVFDPPTGGTTSVSNITITFFNPVLAVIVDEPTLGATNELLGLPGLNYPDPVPDLYGFEATESFTVDGNTVTFSSQATSPGDYFRVITAIPSPGVAAVASVAGLTVLRRRRSS